MIDGDMNFYEVNPFNSPFTVVPDEPLNITVVSGPTPPPIPPGPYLPDWFPVHFYHDHISIEGDINIMRTRYFFNRLDGLESFDGFVARWYIPGTDMLFEATNTTAVITVLIIDTAHEIQVGVGYHWKPVVLGSDQMQVAESIMTLMDANVGDKVALPFDFSGYFGENAKAKLLALMLAGIENVYFDFQGN